MLSYRPDDEKRDRRKKTGGVKRNSAPSKNLGEEPTDWTASWRAISSVERHGPQGVTPVNGWRIFDANHEEKLIAY